MGRKIIFDRTLNDKMGWTDPKPCLAVQYLAGKKLKCPSIRKYVSELYG